jgi:hypothetical protein
VEEDVCPFVAPVVEGGRAKKVEKSDGTAVNIGGALMIELEGSK